MDWPYQNLNQGSTRKQPILGPEDPFQENSRDRDYFFPLSHDLGERFPGEDRASSLLLNSDEAADLLQTPEGPRNLENEDWGDAGLSLQVKIARPKGSLVFLSRPFLNRQAHLNRRFGRSPVFSPVFL